MGQGGKGGGDGMNIGSFFTDPTNWSGSSGIPQLTAYHLYLTVLAVVIGAVIAIPVGAFIGHTGKGSFLVAGFANGFRALPELGLLILFVELIGLGVVPVTLALVVLAIPPFLAGTYSGVSNVDSSVIDAARGMGMREWSILFRVELPIALPLILAGLRTAVLQVIATASIAAYIGTGSLGYFIFLGENTRNYTVMLGGAIVIAVLALVVEGLLVLVQRLVVSPGLRTVRRRRRIVRSSSVTASTMDVETAGGTSSS
ncbi:MAG TPA: ABC transporter permease [Pseudonocardiaceae bacterium]|jgi:osmoprotectant transport system permease protein|nr:ABC transporter permease [Pseudonocardiaceae bacterium]